MTDAMIRHLHETANAVLYRALDLPAGDRQQYIAQATAGDPVLFDEVRTMLSRIEQLDQFLEDPLELPPEVKPAAPVLPRHGERIGRWRVEYELGRNGADLILLVKDEDGAGEAATMRLAQTASRTGQTSARFERLRARLATLEHPAIPAPVDGGITADGRPYFVVGRGTGMPIDQYCAEQQLDLAQRALLFARVCRAVHYMHQHLIVHRDLKPGDILVEGAGLTLLDVGMIGDGWPLDPAYASPDQVAGQPLSTASDIYSLGAVLYTLLSGRLAHGGGDAGSVLGPGAAQSIKPPSLAVLDALENGAAPQTDAALLPGEALASSLQHYFDAIVMQALARDPALRHASAHALALDLENAARQMQAPAVEVVSATPVAAAPDLAPAEVAQVPAPAAPDLAMPAADPDPVPVDTSRLDWPAPRRSALPLAIAMLAAGVVAGVLGAPWLQQSGWLPGSVPTAARPVASAAALKAKPPAAPLPAAPVQGAAEATLAQGILLGEQGKPAEALAVLRRVLAANEARAAQAPAAGREEAVRTVADTHRAIAAVLTGMGDDAGAESALAASRTIYAAQLQTAPRDTTLRARLLDIELARATAQNAQKHGRDTVATLAGLRRLANGPDARIDLLEAYVQPRGTAAQAYAAGQGALTVLRDRLRDPADAGALARAAVMTGEIGLRAKQQKAACLNFDEAARSYGKIGASLTAYDRAGMARLDDYRMACK